MRVKCGKAVPSSRHSRDLPPPSQACLLLNTQIQRHLFIRILSAVKKPWCVQPYMTAVLQNPNFTAAFKVSSCFVRITVADTAIMSEACARVSSMLSI